MYRPTETIWFNLGPETKPVENHCCYKQQQKEGSSASDSPLKLKRYNELIVNVRLRVQLYLAYSIIQINMYFVRPVAQLVKWQLEVAFSSLANKMVAYEVQTTVFIQLIVCHVIMASDCVLICNCFLESSSCLINMAVVF